MYTIQKVSADARQTQTLILPDGTSFTLSLYFRPMQYGWFIDELIYGDFVLRGLRITNSANMLHQWCNQLPFGLACFSTKNREPSLQQDFLSKQSILYVLDASEVAQYTAYLKNG